MYKFIFIIVTFYSFQTFSMKIFDYKNPKNNVYGNNWELITDEVMGGKSTGDFKIIEKDGSFFYRLKGDVSTENNGGFIQFRSEIKIDDEYNGIRMNVKGKAGQYFIHIRTPFTILPWQYYSHNFQVSENWQTIELFFSDFKKSHLFQPSSFNSLSIRTIGFVAMGLDFEAKLDVSSVELIK